MSRVIPISAAAIELFVWLSHPSFLWKWAFRRRQLKKRLKEINYLIRQVLRNAKHAAHHNDRAGALLSVTALGLLYLAKDIILSQTTILDFPNEQKTGARMGILTLIEADMSKIVSREVKELVRQDSERETHLKALLKQFHRNQNEFVKNYSYTRSKVIAHRGLDPISWLENLEKIDPNEVNDALLKQRQIVLDIGLFIVNEFKVRKD